MGNRCLGGDPGGFWKEVEGGVDWLNGRLAWGYPYFALNCFYIIAAHRRFVEIGIRYKRSPAGVYLLLSIFCYLQSKSPVFGKHPGGSLLAGQPGEILAKSISLNNSDLFYGKNCPKVY